MQSGGTNGSTEAASRDFEDFLQLAVDPSVCFLCSRNVAEQQRSREHVFARWMQNAFSLWDQRLTLFNHTSIPYRQVTITACADCNNGVLSSLEDEVGGAFLRGIDAVRELDEERLFLWLGKFYYGLLFRDISLLANRKKPSDGMMLDPEALLDFGVHHLLLRRLLGEVEWSDFPASIFIFEALTSDNPEENFDYIDLIDQPFVAIRCGSTYIAALLQDFGATRTVASSNLPPIAAAESLKLHPLQCTELNAFLATVVKHHRPARMLISRAGQDRSWMVQVLPRGGLSGAPPFEPWDDQLHEAMVRGMIERQWGMTVQGRGAGVPSLLVDENGAPFQAPAFSWIPALGPSDEPS